ncbi:hypothetical protein [Methanothrix thermoacetophila]|uniref:Uncharacterized protein n=1 Tax=Methanothrix thermoacetophila (strain DSM 6194 / JCM 14653 / NBRC 101360 / PT) TaxID=349307 RepID=A0B9L0_METTP|nr:hypothetical protein [Methanothrix thermoacetophila]ABK15384.1 hypothetical protein Mthe_1617 [Methanothrix thermoacetophila PT]
MVEVASHEKALAITKSLNALLLKNTGKKDVTVVLELAGSKALSVPEKYRTLRIKANGYARIPYRFGKMDIGWPIALSGRHTAAIRLWSRDPKSKKKVLIANMVVETRSPIFVPELHCMETTEQEQRARKGNSPPVITMSAVKPRTSVPKNTGEVELSWEIRGADEMHDYIFYPGAEVLEPGTFTDAGGWECSCHVTPSSNSYIYTAGPTIIQTLHARNADGEVYEHETIYYTTRVGYHNARCPAGGTIHTDELDTIRGFLEDIDARLRSNALEDLPEFVDDWNRTIEERIGRGELSESARDYMLPEFDDMDYLSGRVGTGSLADDILSAMENVLIYIKPYTLPRGYRAGTLPPERHALCDCVYGRTYHSPGHPDCNWIAVCIGRVSCNGHTGSADALTLLHELYHHATGSGDEMRAVAVSCCVFDYLAPLDW